MKTKARSIHQIVEDQAQKWNRQQSEPKAAKPVMPVITVSREPGSGGKLIAKGIAKALGLDMFHQAFIRKYFNADIADPLNYDLILNTETVSIDAAVAGVSRILAEQFG